MMETEHHLRDDVLVRQVLNITLDGSLPGIITDEILIQQLQLILTGRQACHSLDDL